MYLFSVYCAYTHLYGYVLSAWVSYTYACMYMAVKARGWYLVSSLIDQFTLSDSVSHWTCSFPIKLAWLASKPPGYPRVYLPDLWL